MIQPSKVVFLGTDKNVYQAGQVVHYRVLVLYTQLNLFNGSCTVSLYNPLGVMVDELDRQSIEDGFNTGSFNLADSATLGSWKSSKIRFSVYFVFQN